MISVIRTLALGMMVMMLRLFFSYRQRMKFYYRNCERNPEPSSSRGRAENCWIMRNYK